MTNASKGRHGCLVGYISTQLIINKFKQKPQIMQNGVERDKLDERELYLRHKVIARENRENIAEWLKHHKEFDIHEFTKAMNMNRPIRIEYGSDIARAYGHVFDAIGRLNKREDKEGLELLEKALYLDPENEEAICIKLDMLGSADRCDEAEQCADKLIDMEALKPDLYAKAYFAKSQTAMQRAYERADRHLAHEALAYADKGLESDGKDYDLVMLKASILYQLGMREYRKWIGRAEELDKERTNTFMKSYWIGEKLL